jgi:integrase
VRIHRGGRKYEWVGTFRTRKEARKAEAAALNGGGSATTSITCGEWADRWFGRYERDRKDSSADTARSALKRFRHDFADRPLDAITRIEAMDWADEHPHRVPIVITMMNAAVDAELLDRNPFRGLQRTTRGRSDQAPPTMEELDPIEQACAVHGSYAAQMRAPILFAAYSGMRPGELFVLEHADIDTEAMRVDVRRRLYRGRVDLPKSTKTRRIALTPPARDALLELPHRTGLVFLPPRVIAEQMGWTLAGTLKLLQVYGHGDIGALEEIDKAFGTNVTRLRAVSSRA